MTRKPSPILSLTRAEYDGIFATNWSRLRHMVDSPAHYRHALSHPKDVSDEMMFGRVIDTAVFEPHLLNTEYAVWGGGVRRGKEWDAFCAEHAGQDIITLNQGLGAESVAEAVHAHPPAKRLLKKGQAQWSLTWTDPETGIRCKCRGDWLTAATAVDLKSTHDIGKRQFGRHCASMLYHGQLGYYNLGLQANGIKRKWRIIAVEQSPPFDVAVYTLCDNDLYAGEELAHECLRKLAECRRKRSWPGRYPKAQPLDLPPWCWPEGDQEERRELMRMEGLI